MTEIRAIPISFELHRLVEDGVVSILQPDLSKTGGVTEGLRIAAPA